MKKTYITPTLEIYAMTVKTAMLVSWSTGGEYDGSLDNAHSRADDYDW